MTEYKVKYYASLESVLGSVFGPKGYDLEIVTADSAKQAVDEFKRIAKAKLGIHYYKVSINIIDVEKI